MNLEINIKLTASDAEIKEFVDDRINRMVVNGMEGVVKELASLKFDGIGDVLRGVVRQAQAAGAAAAAQAAGQASGGGPVPGSTGAAPAGGSDAPQG